MAKPYWYLLCSLIFSTSLITIAVKRVCTLNADLSSIPRHKYTTLRTPIGDFLMITYEHRMTLVNEVSVKRSG